MKKLLAVSMAAIAAQRAETGCYYNNLNKQTVEGLQNSLSAIEEDVATLAGNAKVVEEKSTKK